MGYLLKESLKTLCGVNQWCYAVFWKIGCQNPKLLIWEECYYEPELYSCGIQLLINNMMVENQFSVVGEGLVGRAVITGRHQWILLEGNSPEAYPLEVLKELSKQFSAGIKTIAVIPVLPHGVVQLGSYNSIMENMVFVNNVKMSICQLGCIPGVLLSDEDAMREPAQNVGVPVQLGNSFSEDFLGGSTVLDSVPIVYRNSENNSVHSEMGTQCSIDATFGATNVLLSNQQASFHINKNVGEDSVLPRRNIDYMHSAEATLQNVECSKCEVSSSGFVNQMEENDLFQALGIVVPQRYDDLSSSKHNPCFDYDIKLENQVQIDDDDMRDNTFIHDQSGDDLFDVLGADFKNKLLNGNWNDSNTSTSNISKNAYSISTVKQGESSFGHLLDSSLASVKLDNVSSHTALTNMCDSYGALVGLPSSDSVLMGSCSFLSESSKDSAGAFSTSSLIYGSQTSSWIEPKKSASGSTAQSKKHDETSKGSRKRLKPGENPRPRPKDRQMIQDRLKELREIVPNGAKCSIDSLLERAIKHMLFLQSISRHADKLKQIGESKIISSEGSGICLKDNFDGGATWAYEVGSQSVVCPIVIEDLNQPRQMLVKMLCEERGLFLEIADVIRGLGLTILIGVIETRNEKIWARFVVEANRDVTRMEIFVSLVRLLEQTANGGEQSKAEEQESVKDSQAPVLQ